MGMAKLISRLDESLDGDEGEISDAALDRWFKVLALISGAIGIGFLEGTIKTNNITFEDTQLTDSGQLIPVLIGVFSLVSTIFDAIRARIGSSNSVVHVKEGHKSVQVEGGKL
jgi:TctA family transporter